MNARMRVASAPARVNPADPTNPADRAAQAAVRAPVRPAVRRRAGRRWTQRIPASLILSAVLVAGWQLYVTKAHVAPAVLPSPWRVVTQGWADRQNLWENTIPTVKETLLGFALSITVAWLLAIVCDFSALCRRAIEPLLVISQTIPVIAIAPLFIIWFGFTTLPKVLVVALVTFFPITVSLLQGFSGASTDVTNLMRSMGANRVQLFLRLRVPTALPYFFSGLRISITYAVVGAIFGEYVGAEQGLGIYMQISKNSRRTDLVLAAVVVTAVLSLLLYWLVTAVERISQPWERATVSGSRARRRSSR
jgi:ABC-type nitrate/sulfonate/bicarbonate transport system permease component